MEQFLELIAEGGWTMIPLGLCSLAALTITIERFWFLRRRRVISPEAVRVLASYEGEPSAAPCIVACRKSPGPFASLMAEVIESRQLEHHQAIERMHAIGNTHVTSMERGLTVLEIVAGVSPLIGLLGTVLGMVEVFTAITAQGLGDPQVLSGGISKALVTTIAGLSVAIPSLAFHSILTKRVEVLAAEMQDRATSFIVQLHGGKRSEI